jgi:hypothetical protein
MSLKPLSFCSGKMFLRFYGGKRLAHSLAQYAGPSYRDDQRTTLVTCQSRSSTSLRDHHHTVRLYPCPLWFPATITHQLWPFQLPTGQSMSYRVETKDVRMKMTASRTFEAVRQVAYTDCSETDEGPPSRKNDDGIGITGNPAGLRTFQVRSGTG